MCESIRVHDVRTADHPNTPTPHTLAETRTDLGHGEEAADGVGAEAGQGLDVGVARLPVEDVLARARHHEGRAWCVCFCVLRELGCQWGRRRQYHPSTDPNPILATPFTPTRDLAPRRQLLQVPRDLLQPPRGQVHLLRRPRHLHGLGALRGQEPQEQQQRRSGGGGGEAVCGCVDGCGWGSVRQSVQGGCGGLEWYASFIILNDVPR